MSEASESAAALVTAGMRRRPSPDRPRFLRELLAHAAAGLVILEGNILAAEAVYRLADAVVDKKTDGGPLP